jgi:hypothetical protein
VAMAPAITFSRIGRARSNASPVARMSSPAVAGNAGKNAQLFAVIAPLASSGSERG